MFGFSLPKIVFLLLVIFFVWHIFRIIEKRQSEKDNLSNDEEEKKEFYEALIECRKCGNFYSREDAKVCPVCGAKNN